MKFTMIVALNVALGIAVRRVTRYPTVEWRLT